VGAESHGNRFLTRANLLRVLWVFLAITVVTVGVYYIVYFLLEQPETLMVVLAPIFGLIYAPSIWLAMLLTGSDFPLFLAWAFALFENLVIATVVVGVWARREARFRPAARVAESG